jgi:hypothetical protein
MALDDPGELGDLDAVIIDEGIPAETAEYESVSFPKELDEVAERVTAPPTPTYEMLRDSCKMGIAAEVPLDEEQILRPSSQKIKTKR